MVRSAASKHDSPDTPHHSEVVNKVHRPSLVLNTAKIARSTGHTGGYQANISDKTRPEGQPIVNAISTSRDRSETCVCVCICCVCGLSTSHVFLGRFMHPVNAIDIPGATVTILRTVVAPMMTVRCAPWAFIARLYSAFLISFLEGFNRNFLYSHKVRQARNSGRYTTCGSV